MLIPYTFNILTHFLSFSWQIIHLKNVDGYTFWGEGGSVKVCFVHSINVDNYGWSLRTNTYTCMYMLCTGTCQSWGRYFIKISVARFSTWNKIGTNLRFCENEGLKKIKINEKRGQLDRKLRRKFILNA